MQKGILVIQGIAPVIILAMCCGCGRGESDYKFEENGNGSELNGEITEDISTCQYEPCEMPEAAHSWFIVTNGSEKNISAEIRTNHELFITEKTDIKPGDNYIFKDILQGKTSLICSDVDGSNVSETNFKVLGNRAYQWEQGAIVKVSVAKRESEGEGEVDRKGFNIRLEFGKAEPQMMKAMEMNMGGGGNESMNGMGADSGVMPAEMMGPEVEVLEDEYLVEEGYLLKEYILDDCKVNMKMIPAELNRGDLANFEIIVYNLEGDPVSVSKINARFMMGHDRYSMEQMGEDAAIDGGGGKYAFCQPMMMAGEYLLTVQFSLEGGNQTAEFPFAVQHSPMDREGRRNIDLCLVLDVSGSMKGMPLKHLKEAARGVIEELGSNDIISIISYNDSVELLLKRGVISGDMSKMEAVKLIDGLTAGGNTDISMALNTAMEVFADANDKYIRYLMFLSDGSPTQGVKDPSELGMLASQIGETGVHIDAIGIGPGQDVDVMHSIASQYGRYHSLTDHASLVEFLPRTMRSVKDYICSGLKVTFTPAGNLEGFQSTGAYSFSKNMKGEWVTEIDIVRKGEPLIIELVGFTENILSMPELTNIGVVNIVCESPPAYLHWEEITMAIDEK